MPAVEQAEAALDQWQVLSERDYPDGGGSVKVPIEVYRARRAALAVMVEEAKDRERDVENLTPGGSEFVGSWDNCIGFIQERLRTFGKIAAERNRLRDELAAVFEIAIARGEQLGYADADFRKRLGEDTNDD